jgi:hypothetical protein
MEASAFTAAFGENCAEARPATYADLAYLGLASGATKHLVPPIESDNSILDSALAGVSRREEGCDKRRSLEAG